MPKVFTTLALLVLSAAGANAAQLVLPSVVITLPATGVSQTPVCTKPTAPLMAPAAAGTVVFSCVVPPEGWTGTLQFSGGSPFSVTPLSGNKFNVVLSDDVTTAQSFATPGTITTAP